MVTQSKDPAHLNIAAARYVTVGMAAALTGLTEKAIRRKIEREVWLEGRHWHKRDGGVFIDMRAYELSVTSGR